MVSKNDYMLVTGGLGYIGSHTVIELLKLNKKVIIIDNLSNSKKKTTLKIKKISKKNFLFFAMDIRSKKLDYIFKKYKINLVIHFAGLKAVNESIKNPLMYWENNLVSSINLLKVMKENECKNIAEK